MYLVFDIGGTNIRIAVSTDGHTLGATETISTLSDFSQGISNLKQVAQDLSKGVKIEKIAGGIAGSLDQQKTMLLCSPHIKSWIQKPLKETLTKIFNCDVLLENDAHLGGLGEATKGAGIGKKIVVYLTIGTGVGGVRIVDGKIDQNSYGFEPGHQIIVPFGNPCNCGGRGHLETYVGGSYLEKIYHQKAEGLKDDQAWDQVTRYLSIGLNNTIVHWSPDIVVLGGSVMKSLSLESIRVYLKEELKIFPQIPEIVLAKLGDKAGLYGALELLK